LQPEQRRPPHKPRDRSRKPPGPGKPAYRSQRRHVRLVVARWGVNSNRTSRSSTQKTRAHQSIPQSIVHTHTLLLHGTSGCWVRCRSDRACHLPRGLHSISDSEPSYLQGATSNPYNQPNTASRPLWSPLQLKKETTKKSPPRGSPTCCTLRT